MVLRENTAGLHPMSIKFYFLFFSTVALSSCCAHDNAQTVHSPDGKYSAYACVLDCSAMASFEPAVWVYEKNGFGAILHAIGKDKPVFRCEGAGKIGIRWENAQTLVITTGCELDQNSPKINRRTNQFKTITIKYEFNREWFEEDERRNRRR